jgi:hypothetical protein
MNKHSRDKRQATLIPLQADALTTVNGGATRTPTWTASNWGTQAWRWWQ